MSPMIPKPNYDQLQQADIKQTYWLLYQEIIKDFVHKKDLETALANNVVNTVVVAAVEGTVAEGTGSGQASFIVPNVVGKAKAAEYQVKAKTGKAVREGIVTGAEKAVGI